MQTQVGATETPADFQRWVDDLSGHRRVYRQSSFRWAPNDVLTLVSWATWNRLEFTTLEHLATLRRARGKLRDEMRKARDATAPHILRAAAAGGSALTAEALGFRQLVVNQFIDFPGTPEESSIYVRNATVWLHDNPLIHAWEANQAWTVVASAFAVVDDTITTVVWEQYYDRGTSWSALAAASGITENQVQTRIRRRDREVSETGVDPRRPTPIPGQTYGTGSPDCGQPNTSS